MYAPIDITSYCNRSKIYAYAGDEVEIVNKDYGDVYVCRVRGEKFPCHKDRLVANNPNIAEQFESPLLAGFKKQLTKLGRTKYKALIGAVEDGLISQKLPDGTTKENWLLTAKSIL